MDCFAWALIPNYFHFLLRTGGGVLRADELLEQKYALRASGYDFVSVVQRVAQVMGVKADEVTVYGKSPQTVKARALLCFWAHRKLGMTTVGISGKLGICQSAVSRLSKKGEAIAWERRVEWVDGKA